VFRPAGQTPFARDRGARGDYDDIVVATERIGCRR
jgi:hypothetical protein